MPIQQTKKQDDLEKRLRILRSQVYGKPNLVFKSSPSPANDISDISHLHKDLMKTLALTSIALAVMISLKFLNF